VAIVVDINVLAPVFNPECSGHSEFKPVHDWILKGRGQAVFGGSKYKAELVRAGRYLRLFVQLKTAGRAVEIRPDLVDAREAELIAMTHGTGCDDQHIMAILCVSGCRLVCSLDGRSYEFIKCKTYYPKKGGLPKIYSSSRNIDLLCDRNCVRLRSVA
jgi:hypothetical protein